MENTIQFIQVTPQELENRIIDGVKKMFSSIVQKSDDDQLLNRTETAKLLGISTVTLWEWTNKSKLKSYGIGNKVYYKKSEVIAALKPLNH
ncbi:helix-turn-helix domain-containing protein [Flavobacterium rhizosphaerae]|uniref:Helix-turn-helix domain-containing protein n=1 Tax=Flavobacterium rhizosphaerae TaxID=3163298 RepID=A0ABW8YYQ3_9FLAO